MAWESELNPHDTALALFSHDNIAFIRKRSDLFRALGQFVAKALLDSRIIDVSFNRTFLRSVMGEDIPSTIDTLMVESDSNPPKPDLTFFASRISTLLWLHHYAVYNDTPMLCS